jgi:NhaP-type Na+/H+ and K+/H+ antiporter
VAFLVLGLTVGLHRLPDAGGLWIGLALALLTLVVRPLLVGLLLVPVRRGWGERLFVLWAGLKGAVHPAGQLPAHRRGSRRNPAGSVGRWWRPDPG